MYSALQALKWLSKGKICIIFIALICWLEQKVNNFYLSQWFQNFAKVLANLLEITHTISCRTRNASLLQILASILGTKQYHLLPIELVASILNFLCSETIFLALNAREIGNEFGRLEVLIALCSM